MEVSKIAVRVLKSIRAFDELSLFSGKSNYSMTEFRLLMEVILEKEKGRSIISSELANRLGVTRSAISQIVSKMEKNGVIQRVPSPTDKKIAYIELANNASTRFNEQYNRISEVMNAVVKEFGEARFDAMMDEYDEFATCFIRVRDEKKKEKRGDETEC